MKQETETKLGELQVETIRKLAEEKRRTLGFVGETPIANDIFRILETLKIILLEYPMCSSDKRQAFSAALMYSDIQGEELVFLGLNTADYLDKQIFAIAHELYHYFTKSSSHLSRLMDQDDLVETMANRFAAEFLLPQGVLESIVLKEFKRSSLREIQTKTLLRFMARLQCTWGLPYRSLVKSLKHIGAIGREQYHELYKINERAQGGEYWKYGKVVNTEIFSRLNTATRSINTSPENIELIVRNFEDEIIDESMFAETLALFKKNPEDFGYSQ